MKVKVYRTVFFLCVQLHMLGDGGRGAVIEMTLAKVLYMSSKCLLSDSS